MDPAAVSTSGCCCVAHFNTCSYVQQATTVRGKIIKDIKKRVSILCHPFLLLN